GSRLPTTTSGSPPRPDSPSPGCKRQEWATRPVRGIKTAARMAPNGWLLRRQKTAAARLPISLLGKTVIIFVTTLKDAGRTLPPRSAPSTVDIRRSTTIPRPTTGSPTCRGTSSLSSRTLLACSGNPLPVGDDAASLTALDLDYISQPRSALLAPLQCVCFSHLSL